MNEYDSDESQEHAQWFMQLPMPTRRWLESLRPDDIKEINDAVRLKRKFEAGGWLFKWVLITIVSFFVGAAALGESIQKLIALVFHGGKP